MVEKWSSRAQMIRPLCHCETPLSRPLLRICYGWPPVPRALCIQQSGVERGGIRSNLWSFLLKPFPARVTQYRSRVWRSDDLRWLEFHLNFVLWGRGFKGQVLTDLHCFLRHKLTHFNKGEAGKLCTGKCLKYNKALKAHTDMHTGFMSSLC